ncbi:MAG: twin-arginine translocase TatA/TatE family subunit [Ardenticatenaceae bacterium]|nr:twin-arginine translocase TatA/TatE family subunit [Ardenticatenaceae bacterium]HBY96802.1 twin-arginine translocase TatA/TatE family subunit [Chloroflexota bacterium]
MPFGLGGPELLIVLVVFLIVFGVGRLPEVGGALGRSIQEFRTGIREDDDPS